MTQFVCMLLFLCLKKNGNIQSSLCPINNVTCRIISTSFNSFHKYEYNKLQTSCKRGDLNKFGPTTTGMGQSHYQATTSTITIAITTARTI